MLTPNTPLGLDGRPVPCLHDRHAGRGHRRSPGSCLKGVGIWGVTIPGAWGFAIINFVWWIGIGHAGTLISAILLLFKQTWRNSINRFAEAMTIFAVVCAGMFPLHAYRAVRGWAYWLLSVSEHDERVAAVPQRHLPGTCSRSPPTRPSRWCSGTSAWCRTSALCVTVPRLPLAKYCLRPALAGLAWFYPPLDPLRVGFAAAGRSFYPAGAFGAHRPSASTSRLRLTGWLAHHHLPALLRRWRRVFGLRDGAHTGYSYPQVLPLGRPGHAAPPGQHGEGHARPRARSWPTGTAWKFS